MPTINDFKDRDGVFVGTFMCLGKQYTTKSYMLWYDVRKRCTKGGTVCKKRSGHIPCNARASNEYASKTVMVHAFDRHPNVVVTNYLRAMEVSFSKERFSIQKVDGETGLAG